MIKKYPATREMVNIFPSWTEVRSNDQSLGYQFLNSLSRPLDKVDRALVKQRKNIYLETVNLDEIDVLYRVNLPETFSFSTNTSDPLVQTPIVPTVTGYINLVPFLVSPIEENTVESFWYDSVPDRYSLDSIVSGVDHNLLTFLADEAPLDVDLDHHLEGGRVWLQTVSGVEYLKVEDGELKRARVVIRGITRKGTEESEVLVFPWDMIQPTAKEWKTITKIEIFDMEPQVEVTIKSGNYNSETLLDFYNLRYSDNRRKIDTFWSLGEVEERPTLDMLEYISDEWENLAIGLPEKQVVQSWELLDNDLNTVTGIDLTLQPFTDRAWIATEEGLLYLYDLSEEMVENVQLLNAKTTGSHVKIDYETRYLVRGETFKFIPWHARPVKEIRDYRIWYQTPGGDKFGVLHNSPVVFTSDFSVRGRQLTRAITDEVSIVLDELGEYLFVLEVTFVDGEQHNDRILVKTNHKIPLAVIDLSSDISSIQGIDFNSDQKLVVLDNVGDYHILDFHYDIMLVDFEKKILYFREEYESVDIVA